MSVAMGALSLSCENELEARDAGFSYGEEN
jgi:hypothetical protein